MAINKNFVVKNGLEVKSNLLVADSNSNKVGVGTTSANYELHVIGGIGATDLYISGLSTFVGVGTFNNDLYVGGNLYASEDVTFDSNLNIIGIATIATLYSAAGISTASYVDTVDLRVSGVSTFVGFSTFQDNIYVAGISTFVGVGTFVGDLYVGGDLYIADDLVFDEFNARNINVTGIGTVETLDTNVASIDYLTSINADITGIGTVETLDTNVASIDYLTSINADITGIGTISGVNISSGIVTATSGIVTYYGDGSNLIGLATALTASVGVGSEGTLIGAGITQLNFSTNANAVLTVDVPPSTAAGVATITIAPSVSLGLVIALGG